MQIAELRIGDVGRGLSHYRPVALAVAAIAVMGLTLPGPRRVTKDAFGSAFAGSGSGSVAAVAAPQEAAVEGAPPEVAAAVDAIDSAPASSSFSTFSSSSSSSSSAASSSFSVDAGATRSDTSSSSATYDSSTPATTEARTSPVSAQPLRITVSSWASAQAGTPVASTGVPAGSLPVGRRPGFAQDKVSFVRLAGTASTLKLVPHEEATGQRSADTAQIQACRITAGGWAKGEAQAMADAPTWDCAVSVLGAAAEDGSWTFDLSVFPDRADDRGFALVPVGEGIDFQVAFKLA